MPKCEKGHPMGFEPRCGVCGSPISYRLSLEELSEIREPAVPGDEVMAILVDIQVGLQIQYTAPRGVYALSISLGDTTSTSEGSAVFKRLRGRLWPEYYKEYWGALERVLKIHGAGWASSRVVMANSSSPLSVLVLASKPVDPSSSIAMVTIPSEDAAAPEAVNSYSSLKVVEGRGIPSILITEGFIRDLSGYSEEHGYIDSWGALAYISRYMIMSAESVLRAVSEDREVGVKAYGLASIIGGSHTTFKSPLHAMKSLLYRSSIDMRAGDIQSIHIIASSPKEIAMDIEASYRDYVRGFSGLLNHSIHIIEKPSRLGVYDLVAMVGLREGVEFEWLKRHYDVLRGRNPELDIKRIVGG